MSDKMASAAALWNDMTEEQKTAYKHRAAAEKKIDIEDLDEEGKDAVARSLRKKIDELVRHFLSNVTLHVCWRIRVLLPDSLTSQFKA